ncbi:hypothetical protein HK098_004913 [Nowakowskiella sp. JEL0407]|nr:hypothetical protein HK098_004913 [Nowakowskiella sp. JEL0407]
MIFITGASGGVGSLVLEHAVSHGLSVRAGSRDPIKSAENSKFKSIEWVKFDFNDPSTFADSLRGVEKVFLYIGPNTDKFALEAKKAGVKLIVFMSSLLVLSETPSFIGSMHAVIEDAIKECGIDWQVKNGNVFTVYPKAKGFYVHEHDVAEVAVAALTRTEMVNTAPALTGYKYSAEEIVSIISKRIGKNISITQISEEVAAETMKKFGIPEPTYREIFSTKKRLLTEEIFKKSDDLQKILGKPPRTFEDWVEESIHLFM